MSTILLAIFGGIIYGIGLVFSILVKALEGNRVQVKGDFIEMMEFLLWPLALLLFLIKKFIFRKGK